MAKLPTATAAAPGSCIWWIISGFWKVQGFYMAFIQSLDFFHCIEEHRKCLLKAIQRMDSQNVVKELTPKPSCQIVASIDNIVQDVLESLSKNESPTLTIENRSNWSNIEFTESVGLQMAKNCTTRKIRSNNPRSAQRFALTMKILSVIYKLLQTNTYATKRDIFYENVQLYGSQTTVDSIITDISCMLKAPRRSLHILSTSKGCVAGNLLYIEQDGTKVDCSFNTSGVLVPSNVEGVTNLRTTARFVLIIEKDATFQRLLDDNFCGKCGPCILITGKGVPDLNTRLFVRKLWDVFQIPIFILVDADPYEAKSCGLPAGAVCTWTRSCWLLQKREVRREAAGTGASGSRIEHWGLQEGIEIMCIYKYGSVSMSFEAHNLTVPSIAWLGLLPSDIERLHIPTEVLIPLSELDQRKLLSLQKRPYLSCQPLWKQELEIMSSRKMKAEIQVLTSLSPTFLTGIYLPNKLQYGGWI